MVSKENLLKKVNRLSSPRQKAALYAEFLWEYMLENPAEAAEICGTALSLAREGADESGYYQILFIRGYCRLFMAYYQQAEEDFQESLRYHRRQEDALGEIRILNALGFLSENRGRPRTALIYFHRCLVMSREENYPEREYAAAANAGAVYAGMGFPEKALELLLPLRGVPAEDEFDEHRTVNSANLGEAYLHMEDWEKAEACFLRERDISRGRHDRLHEARSLLSLAQVARNRGKLGEAEEYLASAEELLEGLGDRKSRVHLRMEFGRILEARGKTEDAMAAYQKALGMAEEFGIEDVEPEICGRISEIAAAGGDYRQAYRMEKRAGETARRLAGEDARGQTESLAEAPGEGFHRLEQDLVSRVQSLPRPPYPQISVMRHIGYRIAACLDMEKILTLVYENLNQVIDAAVLGIALYSEKKDELDYRLFVEDGRRVEPFVIGMDDPDSLGVWAIKNRRDVWLDDAQTEAAAYIDRKQWYGQGERETRSIIYIPLMVEEKMVGLLTVQSYQRKAYSEHQLDLLRVLAVYMAIALDNSQTHRRVSELNEALEKEKQELMTAYNQINFLANHDPLTGLVNRRVVEDLLSHSLHQARRRQEVVGLLFIDLDNFKPINDNYGHKEGDFVLKQTAVRLQESLRRSDAIGRIGGDEFVAVLQPIKDAAAARQVAENIRGKLSRPITLDDGRTVSVSSSLGIALYPDDAGSAEELIRLADEAMYRVKQSGRDGIAGVQGGVL